MAMRYYIKLPDPALARGNDPELSFRSQGAEGLAVELQDALRSDRLFEQWRAQQDEPDEVDPTCGATDADAAVTGAQHDLHIDLVVVTSLPSTVLRHRMAMLAGSHWQLADVTSA